MQRAWHTLHPNEALSALESDAERELWAAEARRGLGHFGPNALPEAEQRSSLLAECSLGVGCAGICRRIAYIPL